MSAQYSELRPTAVRDLFVSLGHCSKFQWVSHLGFVTAATSLNGNQPNFALCLAISWAGTLYIRFRWLLPRNGILPGTKFTLCPSLVLSSVGTVTARHSSSGRQPNFATLSRGRHYIFDRAAITLGIGPHSSSFLRPPCVADVDIIFLPCGFFFYLLSFFFSSPNLTGRRVDVCHTSTHGVALVQI